MTRPAESPAPVAAAPRRAGRRRPGATPGAAATPAGRAALVLLVRLVAARRAKG